MKNSKILRHLLTPMFILKNKRILLKDSKNLVRILIISLFLIFTIEIPNFFLTTSDSSIGIKNARINGMGIENLYVKDRVSILTTTGGSFKVDLENGTIEIRQKIGANRLLAKIILDKDWSKLLSNQIQKGFDCVWSSTSSASSSPKIIISGDSVIRFYNIKKLEVVLYFVPAHQKFNLSLTQYNNGGLLALDENGGLAIVPPSYASNEIWPKWFENNEWKLVAEKPLPLLFIGVLPPRQFDWERSFWPVIHYSSHIQRYPTDEEIIAYSKYAKVLEMHSWVWQNRYDESARDEEGNKFPTYADYSFWPQNGKWIPDNEVEFKRVIKTAHTYGMKVLPYVSSEYEKDGNLKTFIAEIKRLKDIYNIDGVYLDGLFYQRPELGYMAARSLREIFGRDGWLTIHDTHGSGYWAPFIHAYMDIIITSEHNCFNRWTSTSYNISNAIASVWPEIPLSVKDGRVFLKTMVDNSLLYNNRVILMTGEQGQWRCWRLYFTPKEMKFMQEYYIKALERMKKVGYEKFISEFEK